MSSSFKSVLRNSSSMFRKIRKVLISIERNHYTALSSSYRMKYILHVLCTLFWKYYTPTEILESESFGLFGF